MFNAQLKVCILTQYNLQNVFMIIYADDLSIKMRLCGNIRVDKQMAAIQTWMDSNQLVFQWDEN